MALSNLNMRLSEELEEAYDIINKTNLVIFKWTLSEDVPTDYVSDNIKLFGYTPDDFYVGKLKDYWEFVFKEDRDRVKTELYWAREHGKNNYKNQYRVICKNGEVKWVEEWVIHERDDRGKLIHEKGIIRDITESVIISEKLKESESRYKELFDNASALIWTFKEDGQLTSYNKSFAEMMGISFNNSGHSIERFLSKTTTTKMGNQSVFAYFLEHINTRIEIEMVNQAGATVAIELHTRIVYKNDQIDELQAVGNDVTDKKLAEAKIKFLTEHDTLTGLHNRLYFDRKLNKLENEDVHNLSIIIGDINGLKMVNDAFGHKMGDQMLMEVSKVLMAIFNKEGDVISRLSGDEFAIITQTRNIPAKIDAIQSACQMLVQFPFVVDISLGYAIRKKMTQSLDSIFREADHQMYRNKLRRTKKIKMNMIESLKAQLEAKSIETAMHSERMTGLAEKMGKFLNLNAAVIEELMLATSMHDIGMVSVDKRIVMKSGKLSQEEFKEIMKHSEIGYHLLVATPSLAGIGEYVLAHHENFDGSGYPQGLKGIEIPLLSRIIAVIDSYEAMTHDRPYRKAMSHEAAVHDLMAQSGKKYDPNLVIAFINCLNQ
jgi:diguanylate cyclase (GGDEF)-like protein/PAS domain S-box-containing protein